jgi:Zn-dependent oligopeptidase
MIQSYKYNAVKQKKEGYIIKFNITNLTAILDFCENEEIRKTFWLWRKQVASQ